MQTSLLTAAAVGTTLAFAAFTVPAFAQDGNETNASPPTTQIEVNAQKPRLVVNFKKVPKDEIISKGIKNKTVCKTETKIGSRLGKKEICATAVEWALRDEKIQQTLRAETLKQQYTCGKG